MGLTLIFGYFLLLNYQPLPFTFFFYVLCIFDLVTFVRKNKVCSFITCGFSILVKNLESRHINYYSNKQFYYYFFSPL